MQLSSLHVRRFRSIQGLRWEPSAGLNLITGDNGQGKTSLLEAIHFGLLGRSFRTARDEECIAWSGGGAAETEAENFTSVEAELQTRRGSRWSKVMLGRGWKRAYRDAQLVERLGDLWEGVSVVTFAPDDVDLFRDAPARRRRFLDLTLCQMSPLYMDELRKYQRALKEVNALLRERASAPDQARRQRAQADAYYPMLGASGAFLMRMRAEHLSELSTLCADLYRTLGGAGAVDLRYAPGIRFVDGNSDGENGNDENDDDEEALGVRLTRRLAELHEESARLGSLADGPHRDDFRTRLEGRELGRFGSQGQHRLAALALKLASARRIESGLADPPILLFDDFGSELDAGRRRAVLESLRGRMQVFVTATRLEDLGGAAMFDGTREMRGGDWV